MMPDHGERLARIEEKLDTVKEKLDVLVGEDGRVAKIERTLRLHDKIIWSCTGAAAIIGYLVRGMLGH